MSKVLVSTINEGGNIHRDRQSLGEAESERHILPDWIINRGDDNIRGILQMMAGRDDYRIVEVIIVVGK